MAVIALSRELGTRGREVAEGVAERLGIAVVHRALVEHDIAERTGLPEPEVHRHLEGEAQLIDRLRTDKKEIAFHTSLEILELAAKGNVLIRGWCAPYILRWVPHVLCARICAPLAWRQVVVMERLGIESPEAARRKIEQSDAAQSAVTRRLFGVDWQDPSHYAAVLNIARIPVDECVDAMVELSNYETFQETLQSRAFLMDEVVRARAQLALARRFGLTDAGFAAHVVDGTVTLTGATTDEQIIVTAVRLLQEVEGVRGVECRIRHVAFVPHGNEQTL